MRAFSPDAARAADLPFPDARVAAAQRAADATWPTPAEEIWRYSRIEELDIERYSPRDATTTVEGGAGLVVEVAAETELPDVVGGAGPDVFADLNAAFARPVVVRVPKGHVATE